VHTANLGHNEVDPRANLAGNVEGRHVANKTQRDAHMQQRNGNFPISSGATLLVAAAACLLGALVPNLVAVIVVAALMAAAIVAFALRRGGRMLETILAEELPPLLPLSADEERTGTSQQETDFVLHEHRRPPDHTIPPPR
jgi:hypothetical protein